MSKAPTCPDCYGSWDAPGIWWISTSTEHPVVCENVCHRPEYLLLLSLETYPSS